MLELADLATLHQEYPVVTTVLLVIVLVSFVVGLFPHSAR